MAFTGTGVVTKISDRMYRIHGVSLAADASGTIALPVAPSPAVADVYLGIAANLWGPYRPQTDGPVVNLEDAVEVSWYPVTDVGAAVPISVVKTSGDMDSFLITLHNDNAALGQVSGDLEIFVKYH